MELQDAIWSVLTSPRASLVLVAGRLLSADHVERRKSAYASRRVAEAGRPRGAPGTGRSGVTGAPRLAAWSGLAVLANAVSAFCP